MQNLNKFLRVTGALAGLLVIVGVGLYVAKTPHNDRVWAEHFEKTNTAVLNDDGTVTLFNVRNWTYDEGRVVGREWIDQVTVDPTQIVQVWFSLEPFPDWSRVGHTYLTFEFADGASLSFSVEARMEQGESYSALRGLFREYELAYTWGTESDFLMRRLALLDHEVYRYPLSIKPETATTIFTALVTATNDLTVHPRFYNTLTANCTNILAQIVNEHYDNRLPYDLSWNLPGSSDTYLMAQGYIKSTGTLEESRQEHALAKHKEALRNLHVTYEWREFSQVLREHLSQ